MRAGVMQASNTVQALRPGRVTMDTDASFASRLVAAASRAVGYALLSDSYLARLSDEQVARKALGARTFALRQANEGVERARVSAAERDCEDALRGLRARGAAHSGRFAEQRRTRLVAEVVAATVKAPSIARVSRIVRGHRADREGADRAHAGDSDEGFDSLAAE